MTDPMPLTDAEAVLVAACRVLDAIDAGCVPLWRPTDARPDGYAIVTYVTPDGWAFGVDPDGECFEGLQWVAPPGGPRLPVSGEGVTPTRALFRALSGYRPTNLAAWRDAPGAYDGDVAYDAAGRLVSPPAPPPATHAALAAILPPEGP